VGASLIQLLTVFFFLCTVLLLDYIRRPHRFIDDVRVFADYSTGTGEGMLQVEVVIEDKSSESPYGDRGGVHFGRAHFGCGCGCV
jgi:hypothetical protein